MEEPKVVKGWMGWAAVGGGVMVYAKTRKEALRRYWAAMGDEPSADAPSADAPSAVREDVDGAPHPTELSFSGDTPDPAKGAPPP